MRRSRGIVFAVCGLALCAGLAGCSGSERCNASNAALPHVVVQGAAVIAQHPDTTARACWKDQCASVAGDRRGVLELTGKVADTIPVTVTLTDQAGTWSTQHVDVDVRNLNAEPARCGSSENRAGAIVIESTGVVENAPDRAQ